MGTIYHHQNCVRIHLKRLHQYTDASSLRPHHFVRLSYKSRIEPSHTLSDNTLDPQLLRNYYGRLFPNDQRGRVRVRRNVARTDGQVCDLESLDTIHIQARIHDATPCAGLHRASTELNQAAIHQRTWTNEKRYDKRRTACHVVWTCGNNKKSSRCM